jgi:hypothetical protein
VMELFLKRRWLTEKSTIGELFIGNQRECYTLEDFYPEPYVKTKGNTCIPCGRFEVVVTHSQRFGVDMPLLLNVPGFAGVRIHTGNTDQDTEGCILVGEERAEDAIRYSRIAYAALFQKIQAARARGELVFINIEVERSLPDVRPELGNSEPKP